MNKGTLYVIAAPSGAGKTSLVRALLQELPDLKVSVSHTTRSPRPGDREGVDYQFVSTEAFQSMILDKDFLEYAKVHSHYYGTSRSWVVEELSKGVDVILEIDWQGARQIRQMMDESVSIFILPPSISELEQRLIHRQQDTPEVIAKRLAAARSEIAHYAEFDYLIVNDHFGQALGDLQHIFCTHRLSTRRQKQLEAGRLSELLAGQSE